MITLYGIKNCDMMQKAFKWLDAKKIKYHFHDYRETGIDKGTIEQWLNILPLEKVLNTRSTTYRELSDIEKAGASDKHKAIKLMMEHSTMIKRPLWDFGNGTYFAGWDEEQIKKMI